MTSNSFFDPSLKLIRISVCFNESSWFSLQVPTSFSIFQLKQLICQQQDLTPLKTRLRLIEENSGITAFKVLKESLLIQDSLKDGSKVALDKQAKRVVRFVESDEEEDKVVEISLKNKGSTVPSTSCPSDHQDLSEIEEVLKKGKKVKLRIKSLSLIFKDLKALKARF